MWESPLVVWFQKVKKITGKNLNASDVENFLPDQRLVEPSSEELVAGN